MKVVPEAGLEPAQYLYRGILSPLRLPISPLRLNGKHSQLCVLRRDGIMARLFGGSTPFRVERDSISCEA